MSTGAGAGTAAAFFPGSGVARKATASNAAVMANVALPKKAADQYDR
jgi:hypothetical protein